MAQTTAKKLIGRMARQAANSGLRWARVIRLGAASLLLPEACASCGTIPTMDTSDGSEAASTGFCCKTLWAPGEDSATLSPTIQTEFHLCEACLKVLAKPYQACPCCASLDSGISSDGRCFACRDRRLGFRWAVALGAYDAALRDAVLKTKKPAEHGLTAALAELLWQRCGERLAEFRPDAVAAVPMHWWRRLRRGGNGPDIVCEVLARRLRAPSLPNLLARRRNTLPQSNLAQERREINVRQAFRVRSSYTLAGARIVLVDDILTSTATAHEAARTLRAAGAAEVVVAVLARAARPV